MFVQTQKKHTIRCRTKHFKKIVEKTIEIATSQKKYLLL